MKSKNKNGRSIQIMIMFNINITNPPDVTFVPKNQLVIHNQLLSFHDDIFTDNILTTPLITRIVPFHQGK
ncbi:hypothetical protein PL78_18100 [Yersinia entomophaga]|uniref:Uncharacterized protein n=1 Tax=Yersinia entomophaga TaxID=935293 RepID=A0ABN4PXL5_YERET|nr:hypothetical protein PL78_18100 [Yersinia entomophaga]OWF84390.1 hypothetical protein B4914_19215 [Yersinia entomophaga]